MTRKTSFISTDPANTVYNELISTLEQCGTPYISSDKALKLKIAYLEESKEENISEWVNYQIELQDYGCSTVCVEFKRLGGSALAFHN